MKQPEPLLIEIGVEEIPSGYIEPALHAFSSMLTDELKKKRIECGNLSIYGTPRRLALIIDAVAPRQLPITTEITGPPERVAYDENGRPTVATKKFAEKAGVSINKIEIKNTEKGGYLCIRKTEKGRTTIGILKEILPNLILSIPFPKTMRWKNLRIAFARPIRSIAALYGGHTVSFTIGDVKSGRYSFGHRFLAPAKIKLDHPAQYREKLLSAFVIPDISARKKYMKENMQKEVAGVGGHIVEDGELCNTVCNLVEYPEVVLGAFSKKFLELPGEILVTAMREHQRYFAVVDDRGNMMPHFVAVSNNRARDMNVVVSGYERVLAARLDDARFFYNTDIKTPLAEMVEKLKSVVYQAKLGSIHDKIERIRNLGAFIADKSGFNSSEKTNLDTAAYLCKADLVSQVVIEFPKLQGIIGRIYAQKSGFSDEVAVAIEEHYRPAYSGGMLPTTRIGAVLGIADKLDTLCGCFLAGMIPTGASDPYALRRQAIGLIQIANEFDFDFSLSGAVSYGMNLFDLPSGRPLEDAASELKDFFKNRMAHMLEEASIPKDMTSAILAVSMDNIPDTWNRAYAFYKMKSQPGFESLAITFKRVVNIIRKADPAETKEGQPRKALFENDAESMLFDVFLKTEKNVEKHLKQNDAEAAFREIVKIKEPVDRFFDDVMVMTDDVRLRKNRLALLRRISDVFARLADFSKIST